MGCHADVLNDEARIRELLRNAAEAAGARVVGEVFQRFAPQGVSGVVVIEESHLSIHTWPERGYAAVDFYTCGDCAPERAHALLKSGLGAQRAELLLVQRGQLDQEAVLSVAEHRREGRG
jgi:S-adenosylmethionine decarboxylase proenzyme